MKKIEISKPGGYEVLELKHSPTPSLSEQSQDEVLVKIHASGVNYADVCVRWGVYASAKEFVGWPITPGFEFSGTVIACGKGVDHVKVDQAILGVSLFGAYADHIVVKAWQVFRLHPEYRLSMQQAAGIPAVFLTAYHALFQHIVTIPGRKILIHSAAGGVGQALVQLSHILQLEITAVVGSAEKVTFVKDRLKAHHVIDKSSMDLWDSAKNIAPGGYDIILDANGAKTLKQSYRHLAPMGKLMIYGFHSMLPRQGGKLTLWHKLRMLWYYLKMPRFNPLFMTSQNKSLISFNLSFLFSQQSIFQQAMNDILRWFEEGKLIPPPITCYALDEVGLAHRAIESGKSQGKLILLS